MPDNASRRVDEWLSTHHGVLTRRRAQRLGMSPGQMRARLGRGEWLVSYRGVYVSAASPATPARALLAAVVAAGRGAAASHLSAAWLWGLLGEAPDPPWVTVPPGRRVRVRSIRVAHPSGGFAVTNRVGIPVTTAGRTLLDCAAVTSAARFADLLDAAVAARLISVAALTRTLEAAGGDRRARSRLRAALLAGGYLGAPAPSVLESRMARLFQHHRLPAPDTEVTAGPAGRYRLDFAFPDRLLALEVDGYAWHSSASQMAADQRRRNALVGAGWTVLVYTWRDVVGDPARVAAEILAAYRRAGAAAVRSGEASPP